jgi:hypothetical protein
MVHSLRPIAHPLATLTFARSSRTMTWQDAWWLLDCHEEGPMNRKRSIARRVLFVGAVGTALACSSEVQVPGSGASGAPRAAANGGQGAGGDTSQLTLELRRYDAERDCFWNREFIDGLYAEEQYEDANLTSVAACVVSPAGDAYVWGFNTSCAIVQTDSAIDWKVPVWTPDYSRPFDY